MKRLALILAAGTLTLAGCGSSEYKAEPHEPKSTESTTPQGDPHSVEIAENSRRSREVTERIKAGKETPLEGEAKLEAAERGETREEAEAKLKREGYE